MAIGDDKIGYKYSCCNDDDAEPCNKYQCLLAVPTDTAFICIT